jgi:hypothetical protein
VLSMNKKISLLRENSLIVVSVKTKQSGLNSKQLHKVITSFFNHGRHGYFRFMSVAEVLDKELHSYTLDEKLDDGNI